MAPMICLASLWKRNYRELAIVTTPNKIKYAKKYGYKTHLIEVSDNSDIMFIKIEVILGAMKELDLGDWVWFTDCDSVITNMNKDIRDVIGEPGLSGIIVSNDFNGINSGSMLVRKGPKTIDYLCWILAQNGRLKCEQDAMQETLNENSHWNGMIQIVPQKSMNSYDYSLPNIAACGKVTEEVLKNGQWHPGDLLIHFPATKFEKRLELCAKYDREALDGN